MKFISKTRNTIVVVLMFAIAGLFGQGHVYEGPDDPAGDKSAEREGGMNGNNIYLYYQNTTEISSWVSGSSVNYSEWPVGPDAVRMLDGVALLVSAMVIIDKSGNPVENPPEFAPPATYDTLFFLQTSYREEMDTDPTGQIEYGFYPVFGYFNPSSENPAISNNANSWPVAGWPAPNGQLKWPGEWNGRFGRGVVGSDLETFFVVNDAQDQEYLGPEDQIKYYPRPGVKIGDKDPNVSIQYGAPWGGLGLRVEQRGFQWNNPQARDAIFWEYSVANVSDYTLPYVAFGYWVDNGIGGDTDDDYGFFDREVDMAYSWDIDGLGAGGVPTGTMGFSYLESPGIPYDGKDNDDDGLIDEKRDNEAFVFYQDSTAGIDDLQKFLDFYHLAVEDLKPHWDADEDQDWDDWVDVNGDGDHYHLDTLYGEIVFVADSLEELGDDIGLDGVGPGDLNYTGPDADGTEGNHRPDYVRGVGSEPDFNATDVSESDMVGLTSFQMFPVPSHSSSFRWFKGDRSMWELLGGDTLIEYLGNVSNLIETFASGPFPLYQGMEERISMSEHHSYDPLQGLNSDDHVAPKLYLRKRIVQVIYESDYQFAKPPLVPTLKATASDGKVILTWDDLSDTRTREKLLNNENDFEAYRIFRSTDRDFSDPKVVTDGAGDPVEMRPIFQCDKIDDISGYANWGTVKEFGYALFMGNETGLTHYYVDSSVINGRTYYYGISAIDYGIEDVGISPAYNPVHIDVDRTTDEILFIPKNIQIATPHQTAGGYVPAKIEKENVEIIGKGSVDPSIISEEASNTGHSYSAYFGVNILASFNNYDHGVKYINNSLSVKDLTTGRVVYKEDSLHFPAENVKIDTFFTQVVAGLRPGVNLTTDIFDGLRIKYNIDSYEPSYDYQNSGWIKKTGEPPLRIIPTIRESDYLAWNYNIIFTDDPNIYQSRVSSTNTVRDEFDKRRLTNIITGVSFNFYVINKNFKDSNGDPEVLDLLAQDVDGDGTFNILEDRVFVGPLDKNGNWAGTAFIIDLSAALSETELPQNEDVYQVSFNRPFWKTDSIRFTVKGSGEVVEEELNATMDEIKVVPNPYIGTNGFEPSVKNRNLSQQRRIMFTHLPADCDIKIFTTSGVLVKSINVRNNPDDGTTYWNLVSDEGLAVAAGIYLYHVKSILTGKEKLDKFAIIK